MFAEGGAPRRVRGAMASVRGQPPTARAPASDAAASNCRWTRRSRSRRSSGAMPKTPADILAGAESRAREDARQAASGFRSRSHVALALAVAAMAAGEGRDRNAHGKPRRQGRGRATTASATRAKFDLDFKLDDAEKPAPMGKPRVEPALATAAAERDRRRHGARAVDAAGRGAGTRQARPFVRSRAYHVRGSDAVGARRPVARRRDQARPRQGVPGNGRRRRRARNPAGSAARGRRPAEGGSEVAARRSSA